MEKSVLTFLFWILILGGLFGFVNGLIFFFTGGTPAQYGVMGIGGGFWLLSASITIYIRKQIEAN